MKQSVKNVIYRAIVEKHWIEVEYLNTKGETTYFCCGIFDLDIKNNKIKADIFNAYKDSLEVISKAFPLSIERIKRAKICEQTYYEVPESLIDRVIKDPKYMNYLDVIEMDNNILRYLSDCYKQDNDPYIRTKVQIGDIYRRRLEIKGTYQLDNEQFRKLIDTVFKTDIFKAETDYRYCVLAINDFSISINNKLYVVAYRQLELNFKDKTLKMADKATINKSFLIEGKRYSLGSYLDMDPDVFCDKYNSEKEDLCNKLKANLRDGEIIDTTQSIFLIRKECQRGVDEAFESINEMEINSKPSALSFPLKGFFGKNRSKGSDKEFNLVVFDRKKINRDQMRVIYNSMSKHCTYVQGPPGTGKTETIFNVLLSAYCNNKTVLVCSNNNHPVDDIYDKMAHSLKKKDHHNRYQEIVFPIIRLGNNTIMKEAIIKLREFLSYAKEIEKIRVNEVYTENSKSRFMTEFKNLKSLLNKYEEKIQIDESIQKINKILENKMPDDIKDEFNKKLENLSKDLESMPSFDDEEFAKYAISASEDINFQNYIFYSAVSRLRKLLSPTYKELVKIIKIDIVDDAANELNKYLKDDINLRRFLDIFPIVICTNLSCDKLGTPKPQFDLCIMDEAGQCNIATSLIPIVRATDLLLVGDTNQLQPVTVIETELNNRYKEMYNVGDEYDYVQNSILSTMLRKDINSTRILLRYHYRCGKKIAGFVNQRFYDRQLKLVNQKLGNLTYINVKNEPMIDVRNAYIEEAKHVAEFIKTSGYKDVAIITPFVNQATLINKYLDESGINDCRAGTIHTLQGSEKSTIIMSAALSLKTSKRTMDWVKNNAQLLNVAVTRAKDNFVFIGDKEAIDLLDKSGKSDLKALSDYVFSNGEILVPKSENVISTDFSNNSKSEKQFFDTISPYFAKKTNKFIVERNVSVIKAIKNVKEFDLLKIGKKEFDVVIKVSTGFLKHVYRSIIVFEIDGGEHVGSSLTTKRDVEKAEICKKYGVDLIRISNSEVKDYELIISLFEQTIQKDLKVDKYQMISLFEDY